MSSSHSTEHDTSMMKPDSSSPVSLVERGLRCIEQGHYAEGADLFKLAREQLFTGQGQLTAALDTLNQATMSYLDAQRTLLEASKHLAESDVEQQAQIAALKKLLPTLVEDVDIASYARVELGNNSKGHQSLQLLRTPPSEDGNPLPTLYLTCFGHFEVRRFSPYDQPINLCHNLKGQAVLRYLMAQPKHRETADMLMAALWPEDAPEVALHKLRIAISALRCSLNRDFASEPGGGYILCKGQIYQLNPSVVIHSDVDEFLSLYRVGQQANSSAAAAGHFEAACRLYTGPFMSEDLYTDWPVIQREELSKTYIAMCAKLAEFNLEHGCHKDAAKWAIAILKVDHCDEEAHRQLMQAYAAQGRRSEALRQYQRCQRVLQEELGVQPMLETQRLFHIVLNGEDFLTSNKKSDV